MAVPNSYDYNGFAGYLKNEVLQDVALDIGWEYEEGADTVPVDVASTLTVEAKDNAYCVYITAPASTPLIYKGNKVLFDGFTQPYVAVRDTDLTGQYKVTVKDDVASAATSIPLDGVGVTRFISQGTTLHFDVTAHNEVQKFYLSATGGSPTFPNQITWPYGFWIRVKNSYANFLGSNENLSAADVQTAIQAMSDVGSGNATVTRTGSADSQYIFTVTFTGALANTDIPLMTGHTRESPGPDLYFSAGEILVQTVVDGNPTGADAVLSAPAQVGEKTLWVTALSSPVKKGNVALYSSSVKLDLFPYIVGVIPVSTDITLNIQRQLKTHPAYRSITDETLALMGHNEISDVTGLNEIQKLRMRGRIEAWRAILSVTMGDINFESEGTFRNRSQIFFSAREQVQFAEQEYSRIFGSSIANAIPFVETSKYAPIKVVW